MVEVRVRQRRAAIFGVFGLSGFDVASWLSRIPTARADLHASTFDMGLLALAIAIGSISGFTVAGRLSRVRPADAIAGSLVLAASGLAVAAISAAVGESVWGAFAGLLLLGFGAGVCNVVMNVEAADLCRQSGRDIMAQFHAVFSIGSVVGAAVGTLATAADVGVLEHLLPTAGLVAAGGWAATRPLRAGDGREADCLRDQARSSARVVALSAWRERRTIMVGVVALGMSFATGSANDWIALSMVNDHRASAATGSLTYGVFVVSMTAVRLVGPRIVGRLGAVFVVRLSAVSAALGIIAFVSSGWSPWIPLAAAVLWGAGAALGFPMAMSAAGAEPARAAARIGVVATIGYGASLGGPTLIGFVGQQAGLSHALLLVVMFVTAAGFVAHVLRAPGRQGRALLARLRRRVRLRKSLYKSS